MIVFCCVLPASNKARDDDDDDDDDELGEVGNKTISSSQYTSEIFSPKIIKIGQYLTKL